MDEAERCDRLAYLSYGNLLTSGTAAEVIAGAQLTTWSVSGAGLQELAVRLRATPGVLQAVAFGTRLHISGTDPAALERAIAPFRTEPGTWQQISPGLEDVFIHLMGSSKDNFSL
jgi:ABC-2 type transport system ATP-binding protein